MNNKSAKYIIKKFGVIGRRRRQRQRLWLWVKLQRLMPGPGTPPCPVRTQAAQKSAKRCQIFAHEVGKSAESERSIRCPGCCRRRLMLLHLRWVRASHKLVPFQAPYTRLTLLPGCFPCLMPFPGSNIQETAGRAGRLERHRAGFDYRLMSCWKMANLNNSLAPTDKKPSVELRPGIGNDVHIKHKND